MKIGLVLGGGGARGAYQIGVWKAFKELKIDKHINVISGASIGALNAVLYAQGDIELAEKVWYEVTMEKILPTDSINLFKRSFLVNIGSKNMSFIKKYIPKVFDGGNISRSGLENIIDESINFEKIRNGNIKIYAVCTEIPKIKARYFLLNGENDEKIKKILHGSSAIPMIFENEEIDGTCYIDGGIADNVPINPVYYEKCDLIIVIGLMKGYRVDRSLYPNTQILEIIPSHMEEGFIEGALNFTEENSRIRIETGYNDTLNQVEPIISLIRHLDKKEKKLSKIDSILKLLKIKKI